MGRKLGPFDLADLNRIKNSEEAIKVIYTLVKKFDLQLCGGILSKVEYADPRWAALLEERGLDKEPVSAEVWAAIRAAAADWIEEYIHGYWCHIDAELDHLFVDQYGPMPTKNEDEEDS